MESWALAEQKFAEELPPIEALRAWLLLFVDYIAAKQLIALLSMRCWVIQRSIRGFLYTDLGSNSRTGEARDQER